MLESRVEKSTKSLAGTSDLNGWTIPIIDIKLVVIVKGKLEVPLQWASGFNLDFSTPA
jgi:hypothetical protein